MSRMHPAARLVLRSVLGLLAVVAIVSLLAGCGGGGQACTVERAGAASRTLSFAQPVSTLHSVALAPAADADVRATVNVSLSGTGTHSVLLRLTTARPGQGAVAVGEWVSVSPGAARPVVLTARLPAGAQTVSIGYALVGVTAEGQTLASDGATVELCE